VSATFSTIVFVKPWEKNGKTYVRVKATIDLFKRVDAAIRNVEPDLEFSPFLMEGVTLKFGAGALVDRGVQVGDTVRATVKLGNFGAFGYCWIVSSLFAESR
jgi:hypothetical protein